MLAVGDRIDEWVVEGPLGAGGTASVYRCHNATAARITAALKVLDPGALTRPDARARLAREGEVLHGLEHPNIVRVLGVRPDASPPYLVMNLVEGERLSARIQRVGPQAVEDCLPLLEALAEAVAYLHDRGIQHRDLKPANVLLPEEDRPVLVDFGMVLEAGASRLTEDGLHMGTVSYVPPEWATPHRIDPVKWDVYSLGCMFWEVLVGRRAFPLPDDMAPTAAALEVMTRKRGHPPLDPGPDAPFFLRVLIREMTHPDPAERPADGAEVLLRLRAGDAAELVDPVDLFRTPMPAWQQSEPPGGAPTLDRLATSEIPPAPGMVEGAADSGDWWGSFAVGALVGGGAVALVLAALLGWYLGRSAAIGPDAIGLPTEDVLVVPDPAPAPIPPGETEDAPRPAPAPAPAAPAPEAPARPVSAVRFGAWVELHPEWARAAAIAAGRADEDYLDGWEGGVPAGPATRVSWEAATAFCAEHGGLLGIDAEPTRWERSPQQPYMEYRQADGKPAWRAGDGRSSAAVDPALTNHATGFRCAGG